MEQTAGNRNENEETNPEVSLPGSEVNSVERPAILQVLNPLNVLEEKLDETDENLANRIKLLKQSSAEELQTHNDVNDTVNSAEKNIVNNSHLIKRSNTPSSTSPTKDCKFDQNTDEIIVPGPHIHPRQDKILDIESHLIETYNELFPNEDSVGINELPPIEDELRIGSSKIETKPNVRTVIEVEPAKLKTKLPIKKEIQSQVPLQAARSVTPSQIASGEPCPHKKEVQQIAEQLIENIEEEITNNWSQISSEVRFVEPNKKDRTRTKVKTEPCKNQDSSNTGTLNENREAKANLVDVETEILPASQENTNEYIGGENLSEVVNRQLLEVNSILDAQGKEKEELFYLAVEKHPSLKVVAGPSSQTAAEENERKLFLESLPPLQNAHTVHSSAEQLAVDCKREYYQSLKKYLVQSSIDKPPLPLQTYRWEDLRRAKERGGYPWTHLYKRPLGPDEEPEIVLMLRKSQEIRFTSESPKSNKKVRIDDHVSIQETERYIQELSEQEEEGDEANSAHLSGHEDDDLENRSLHSENFSFVSDSVLTTGKQPEKKSGRFSKVRRLFRRRRYGARRQEDAQSLPDSFTNTSLQHSLEQVSQVSPSQLDKNQGLKKEEEPIYIHSKAARCFPIMKKLKSIADRQKKRLHIKRIHIGKDDKIVLNEEPKILKLKNSPKSQRSDIPHFIEKQDSDDVLEIVELDESPSRKRRDDDRSDNEENAQSSIVKPEEIIEISGIPSTQNDTTANANRTDIEDVNYNSIPPKKAPRLRREHVYEEIEQPDEAVAAAEELKFILDATSVDAVKQSLATQDNSAIKEVTTTNNNIPLDRMGSSEEEAVSIADRATPDRKSNSLLAPISSIDSASSDEDKSKLHLQPVAEEETEQELDHASVESEAHKEHKACMKKEASPAPSEKKVTFSHVEDEAEPHREDVELAAEQLEATREATKWRTTTK